MRRSDERRTSWSAGGSQGRNLRHAHHVLASVTRLPRTLTVALPILLVAVLAAAAGPALARGRVRTVAVPHLTGDVSHAYAMLRHHGFRVSIAHPFTLRSDALTSVTSVSPKAGRRVRHGSVVTLTVRCCRRLAHPPHVFGLGAPNLPRMTGRTLGEATALVRSDQKRYRATAGSLRAATAPALAGNYVITRQSVPAGGELPGTSVLVLAARQGRPAPCTAPYFAQILVRDRQAVVYDGTGPYGGQTDYYYSCLQRQNVERVFESTSIENGTIDTLLLSPALAGTRFAAVVVTGGGKYASGPGTTNVVGWDLATGKRRQVDNGGELPIYQLTVNRDGFVAWRTKTTPSQTTTALTGISCPAVSFCAASDRQGSVLTSTDPTGGRSAWTQTQLPISQLNAIACPDAGLCVAAGNGQLMVSTGPTSGASAWQPVPLADAFSSVACASRNLCVAVGGDQIATSSDPADPSSWTLGSITAGGLDGVACPSATLCTATAGTGVSGDVVTSTDPAAGAATWSAGPLDSGHNLFGIACGSPAFCITGDGNGGVFTTANPAGGASAWSETTGNLYGQGPFGCASNDLCIAGLGSGLLVLTDPAGPPSGWSEVALPLNGRASGVSCVAGGGLCAAIDQAGDIAAAADPKGGASAWTVAPVDTLPCVASGGCTTEAIMVGDDSGVRTLDSTATGNGAQLQNLHLHGDALTWTHDGAPRSATLG